MAIAIGMATMARSNGNATVKNVKIGYGENGDPSVTKAPMDHH